MACAEERTRTRRQWCCTALEQCIAAAVGRAAATPQSVGSAAVVAAAIENQWGPPGRKHPSAGLPELPCGAQGPAPSAAPPARRPAQMKFEKSKREPRSSPNPPLVRLSKNCAERRGGRGGGGGDGGVADAYARRRQQLLLVRL